MGQPYRCRRADSCARAISICACSERAQRSTTLSCCATSPQRHGRSHVIDAVYSHRIHHRLTSLDFLGLGLPPGSPSLGELLSQGKNNLQAPWLGISAFFSLAIMLTLLTFIGEAVRDAFDPRKTNL